MSYVVTQHCIHCKYTDCVTVCPVDAFHEGPDMLYINPDTCVSCDACVPACPVEAIYAEENLPSSYQKFIAMNQEGSASYPNIVQKKPPLPTAKTLDELKAMEVSEPPSPI